MLIIGILVFLLLAVTGNLIIEWQFKDKHIDFFPNGWLAISGGIFQAVVKVHSSLLQTREKQETFFWSNLFLFTGIVVFTLTGLYLFPSTLIGPLGGRALALSFIVLWVIYRIGKEFGFHLNLSVLGESFYFNLYTFIYQIQQWFINYFDRILMLAYIPLSSIGVYDFAIKCVIGLELFMNGLHSSFVPKVMKILVGQKLKSSTPETNRYYYGFIAVMMLVVSASILIVPMAITWLSNYLDESGYKRSVELIPFISVLFLLRSIRLYFGLPYTILKYTKPLPIIYSVVAFVKIGGVVLLANYMGVKGVILASGLSLVVELLLVYSFSKNRFSFKFNVRKILLAPILLLVIILFGEIFLSNIYDVLRELFYSFISVIILWLTYRNDLKTIKIFDLINWRKTPS
jgi:O-antigen/teichoic acid export membrane protein